MIVNINVTADHIARGRPACCDSCPITLALTESTGIEWMVVAGHAVLRDTHYWLWLPDFVWDWILTYDREGAAAVAPFSFALDLALELLPT